MELPARDVENMVLLATTSFQKICLHILLWTNRLSITESKINLLKHSWGAKYILFKNMLYFYAMLMYYDDIIQYFSEEL